MRKESQCLAQLQLLISISMSRLMAGWGTHEDDGRLAAGVALEPDRVLLRRRLGLRRIIVEMGCAWIIKEEAIVSLSLAENKTRLYQSIEHILRCDCAKTFAAGTRISIMGSLPLPGTFSPELGSRMPNAILTDVQLRALHLLRKVQDEERVTAGTCKW